MDYLTTVEAAKKWNISSRMAAYYCEAGRVKGAGILLRRIMGAMTRHLQSTIPKTCSDIWDLPGKLCAIMRKSACLAPREARGASTGNSTCMTCPA